MILEADLETLVTYKIKFFATILDDFQHTDYCHKEIPLKCFMIPRSTSGSLSLYSQLPNCIEKSFEFAYELDWE